MLELRTLSRKFGRKSAVEAVDLSISKGEMVGITGRSGAGKSTLLRLINRLIAYWNQAPEPYFTTQEMSRSCGGQTSVNGSATAR